MTQAEVGRSVAEIQALALLEEWKGSKSLINRVFANFFAGKTEGQPVRHYQVDGIDTLESQTAPNAQGETFTLRLVNTGRLLTILELQIDGDHRNRGHMGYGPTAARIDSVSGYRDHSSRFFLQGHSSPEIMTFDDPRTAGLFTLLGELGQLQMAAVAAEAPRASLKPRN